MNGVCLASEFTEEEVAAGTIVRARVGQSLVGASVRRLRLAVGLLCRLID